MLQSQGGKTIPKSVITNSQYNKTLLQRKLHGVVPIQRVKGTLIRDSRGRIIKDKNGNPMIAHTTI